MFSPFERYVAGRYLRSKRKESFISVIAGFSFTGIMLGVATLIIVMSVMNGFRHELISRILGVNGHLTVQGSEITRNYEWADQALREINGVKLVTPIVEGQVLLQVKNVSTGAMVRGMSEASIREKTLIADNIIEGSLDMFEGAKVLIGQTMARRLKLSIGDTINMVSPQGKASPFGTMPKSYAPEIVGIFDIGMHEYDSGFIFMPLEPAQKFFNHQGRVSMIQITSNNPEDLDDLKLELANRLGESTIITDWKRVNNSFFNALQVERNVMFLILTLIILVAAFNIISSLIMLVKDKGREIAILRTMGASRRSILKIFILTGASVGMLGTAAGAFLGIMFAVNIESIRQFLQSLTGTELFSAEIYFLSRLPAIVDWNEVIVVVVMAIALSLLATIYPAWRASKLDPVEALRYE